MIGSSAKKTAMLIGGIVIIGIIITGVLAMLFKMDHNAEQITELEGLTLRLSGMRLTEEFAFTVDGNEAVLSCYRISYQSGEEEKVLIKKTVCETQSVIDRLNEFQVIQWNGFHGKHPKGVLDGTMFTLTATVNGGKTLHADGSQNFPKHFGDFERWLQSLLKDIEEINSVYNG